MHAAIVLTTVFLTVAVSSLAGAMARVAYLACPHGTFAAFFILLRVRMFLDDLVFLKAPPAQDMWLKSSLFMGIGSWFFWLLLAVHVDRLDSSLKLGLFAVALSTIWVIIDGLRPRFRGRHTLLLGVNFFYPAIGVIALSGQVSSSRLGWLFIAWFAVCLCDLFASKNWDALAD